MKELLDKLSTYNIFNYLLPGIVFVILADEITNYSFAQQDIIIGLFLYYFIGIEMISEHLESQVIDSLLESSDQFGER